MTIKPEYIGKLDALIEKTMKDSGCVGLAMSVFDGEGNILLDRFLGCRDREKKLPLDENTVLGLASVTKSFTALSIMQLVQRGLLDVYAPVGKYIPEFKRQDILVAHLLSHAAGFYPLPRLLVNDVKAEMGLTYEKDGELAYHKGLSLEGARQLIDRMNGETEFIGKPGEYYSYSNDGFALLSDIVRRLGGEDTYADYLDRHVLGPLGMTRSSCRFEWDDDNVTRLHQMENGEMTDHHDFYDLAFALMGEGNMRSTIADMRRYVGMYLNYGKAGRVGRIVDAYGVREMIKPRQVTGLGKYYGYGLSVDPGEAHCVVGHGGNLTGVASYIAWSYELGVGLVVISNTSETPVSAIADAVFRAVAGKEPEQADAAPALACVWPAEFVKKVCGHYESREGVSLDIVPKGEGVSVTLLGEEVPAQVINPYMLRLRYRGVDMDARIYLDENDQVWAMDAGGRVIPKKK